MTQITMRLPIELANAIYSFVGRSPTATIIRSHLEKKNETCICDLCKEETEAKYYMPCGQCDMCYVSENPDKDTGLGRDCDICLEELHMYNWCKITGVDGGEYCMDCFHQQMESDEEI